MWPEGFRQILVWIKNQYDNVPVFITENGVSVSGNLNDTFRESYHHVKINWICWKNLTIADILNDWLKTIFSISVIPSTITFCYEGGQVQCDWLHSVFAFRCLWMDPRIQVIRNAFLSKLKNNSIQGESFWRAQLLFWKFNTDDGLEIFSFHQQLLKQHRFLGLKIHLMKKRTFKIRVFTHSFSPGVRNICKALWWQLSIVCMMRMHMGMIVFGPCHRRFDITVPSFRV